MSAATSINAAALLMDRGAPSRTALACGERSISWSELRLAVARAAAAWRDCGVERGEVVQLHLPHGLDRAIAYLGAVWCGAVPVPLSGGMSVTGQPWDAAAPCRFILAPSRQGYAPRWRDSVLTLQEWAMYQAEAVPCAPERVSPEAPACWTEPRTRDGRGARLLPHGFAASRLPNPQHASEVAHTSTVLGMLKTLRRGGTALIAAPRRATASAPRPLALAS